MAQARSAASIPVTETAPRRPTITLSRPRSRILAKDHARGVVGSIGRGAVHSIVARGDGAIAVGFGSGTAASAPALQYRDGPDYNLSMQIAGYGNELEVAPERPFMLASGRLQEGDEAACHLFDATLPILLDSYPLRTPYRWLEAPREDGAGGRFLARTPALDHETKQTIADPELVAAHPEIAPFLDRAGVLLEIDRDAKSARPLLHEELPQEGRAEHLCVSPDRATLYLATRTDVVAVDLRSGKALWKRQIGTYGASQFVSIYALALSPDGALLATGGIAAGQQSGRALTLLDARSGEILVSMEARSIGGSSITALAWHPRGWLAAGGSSGAIGHVTRHRRLRVYKGSPKGIRALLFVDDGAALLAGGAENGLRLYTMLDDERDGRF
jgi:hypothetical protein